MRGTLLPDSASIDIDRYQQRFVRHAHHLHCRISALGWLKIPFIVFTLASELPPDTLYFVICTAVLQRLHQSQAATDMLQELDHFHALSPVWQTP